MTDEKQALGPGRVRIEAMGRPRTKGSLIPTHRKAGPGACKVGLREDGEHSVAWKNTMINAIRRQCVIARYAGPVVVDTFFRFEREGDSEDLWPTGRQYGDEDKLRRNALDALTQSGLILDDSLVIGGLPWKRFTLHATERPGVTIKVRPADDRDLERLIGMERS
jgi:Holliday junction resolvase RusA-like endonuclease